VQTLRLLLLSVMVVLVLGAQGGRLEQQKRLGFAYLKDGKYDNAAAKLEEIWDLDKSDPMVGEGLAIAYLNGSDRKANPQIVPKANQMMEKALADGGRAVFIVVHSHERLSFLQGHELINFCSGQLQVRKDRISYVSESGDKGGQHSFDLPADAIKEIAANSDHLTFHIKGADGKNFNLAPRSRAQEDSEFLLSLAGKYVKPSSK
jgi:hypothetical protein